MPDKPINEYDFFKEIIERKKNSGCSACRQEGMMLEAQVMDMMRERMENANRIVHDNAEERNGSRTLGVVVEQSGIGRGKQRSEDDAGPVSQLSEKDKQGT